MWLGIATGAERIGIAIVTCQLILEEVENAPALNTVIRIRANRLLVARERDQVLVVLADPAEVLQLVVTLTPTNDAETARSGSCSGKRTRDSPRAFSTSLALPA